MNRSICAFVYRHFKSIPLTKILDYVIYSPSSGSISDDVRYLDFLVSDALAEFRVPNCVTSQHVFNLLLGRGLHSPFNICSLSYVDEKDPLTLVLIWRKFARDEGLEIRWETTEQPVTFQQYTSYPFVDS